ncbi:MAG: hypothetical protein JET69_00730 [Methanomassiliicoccales archaeon]|nr:hypothetical protein [Methanomassiliicoccales archaeon]
MEGSASAPAAKKRGVSKKVIAIVVVAVLVVAAIGAAVLVLGNQGKSEAADNWLEKGFNLEIFYNSGNSERQTACELIKQGLESLNPGKIKITVTPLEWSNYLEYRKTGKMAAMFLGWAPDYADPDDYLQPFYLSGGTYASMIGYNNETLDGLITAAASELNETERAAMYAGISEDMYNECIYLWTSQANNFAVQRDWVNGYYYNPMYSNLYYYALSKTASATQPDTFRYASSSGNAESFDPAVDYETVGGELLQNVYETLVWYNGSSGSDLVPLLASEVPTIENGGISADGKTYTFNLRSGVTFSDGTAMTAEDVKYSFDRGLMLNDPHGPFWMYGQVLIPDYYNYGMATYTDAGVMQPEITQAMCDAAIWMVDSDTVQFNLTQAYPAFLSALAFNAGSIVSKAYVEANGGQTKAGYTFMSTHMMGTGPFKLGTVQTDAYYNLDRNDNYWREPAALAHVIISQVPETNSRLLQLENGDVDAAYIPRAQKTSVEAMAGVVLHTGSPSFNVDFLGLNQKLNLTGSNPDLTNVPTDFFADKNVRLAFAHAFNYGTFINSTMQGTSMQPNGAIPKGMFGYDANVPIYEYDLELAKEYLKAAKVSKGTSSATVMDDLSAAIVRLWD